MKRMRVGILISGGGTNMSALIAAAEDPDFPAEIAVVISSRPDARGLEKARAAGVHAVAFDHRSHDRAGLEMMVDAELEAAHVELVCLAGWMRLLSPYFVAKWADRLINIHPSLLPSFRGLHTHERALEADVKLHGCSVHFVRQDVDTGPIVAQAAVPVLPGDDADALAARVLEAEHRLYPHALRLVASGSARVEGERVVFDSPGLEAAPALLWPPA
jgi:phosphoribosylglycinamide formyltransferase-1